MSQDLKPDIYPGYEWVATIAGDALEMISHIEVLFSDQGIDGYCPGTSTGGGGILVVYSQASHAREVLRSDPFLKEKWVYLETPEGRIHL